MQSNRRSQESARAAGLLELIKDENTDEQTELRERARNFFFIQELEYLSLTFSIAL